MKNLILTLVVAILAFGFGAPEAEAKRLGGGSSFGMKRQATPQQAPRQPAASQTPASGAPAAAPKRSWMGPIAGLAAGLGLAALFSHLGLGEGMASFVMMLLLAAAAFFVFRLLFRRGNTTQRSANLQYAGAGAAPAASTPAQHPTVAPLAGFASSGLDKAIADGFDVQGFARQAKLNFIRLQAANDAANLDDLREFTTPEVFAELRMQITERGPAVQSTDVIELNADVVEVAEENERFIVSVRFNGLLREEAGAAPAPFDEIWHLSKPIKGEGGWLVAGIQQAA